MNRASAAQRSRRVNQVLQWIQQQRSSSQIVQTLVDTQDLSDRQARRYFREASRISDPIPVPEPKAVFTVKLPVALIAQVRKSASGSKHSLSHWVAEALSKNLPNSDPPNG